ncbi:hypothetical protein [Paenibacillus sp. MMS20-IR301]|uniref:hypothetical protein n=1 Tax=Paenibacillus sp. MMS20-IR301 TaxID=2895946 RepID=UPI0028EA15F1|nr:hypothetical protein [Paenibacillus sp. MMS20-IR301]WNS43311.1 hypothetical protein LOS79_30975 [Paenibacillus sp. MMS20-IR301]
MIAAGVMFISLLIISLIAYAKPVHAALVNYSAMVELSPDIYIEPDLSQDIKEELLHYVDRSRDKLEAVFGGRSSEPCLILALSAKQLDKYAENPTGQTYYLPWRNYIVIGPDGFNENVISHELTHAELRERLHNRNVVPVWFDEGLASMVDGRFAKLTTPGETKEQDAGLAGLEPLDTHEAFNYGTAEAWKNYITACSEVTRWYSIAGQDGLLRLIHALNQGADFTEQYIRIEQEG